VDPDEPLVKGTASQVKLTKYGKKKEVKKHTEAGAPVHHGINKQLGRVGLGPSQLRTGQRRLGYWSLECGPRRLNSFIARLLPAAWERIIAHHPLDDLFFFLLPSAVIPTMVC
jgi:hypothetical protein